MKTNKKLNGYTYDYPKADNTVDAVVFGLASDKNFPNALELHLLLIQRRDDPFKGSWALPGGFVEMEETLDQAVLRELEEETSIKLAWMDQLYTFGDPGRDPRGRVISTSYLALVKMSAVKIEAGDDATAAQWFPVSKLPKLAFDHSRIIKLGLERLRSKVRWQPIGINLLPQKFTLVELQRVYESILGRKLDKRNFRSKVTKFGVLIPDGKKVQGGRPAVLYKFDKRNYKTLQEQGIDFEIQ